ncbi:hypothetical protein ACG2F4_01715 [Halalkalibaculum sp. DA3122]|uniref:hypothetical protein n=1 Tax=Halalkalibaculum sp. DA3122 TaxID=3373607 RepID=UPI00375469D6
MNHKIANGGNLAKIGPHPFEHPAPEMGSACDLSTSLSLAAPRDQLTLENAQAVADKEYRQPAMSPLFTVDQSFIPLPA